MVEERDSEKEEIGWVPAGYPQALLSSSSMTFPGSHAASPPPGRLGGAAIATVTPFYRRVLARPDAPVSFSLLRCAFSYENGFRNTGDYGSAL
ncbi:hypothetical protein NHX12_013130 [Muraenolepis orangiensis]|uniref:Uncharacterized protein n=1 Tax=Muraenolepis orangiensis TaxID=630683 RepID=A0A9Q0I7S2_9TELE|nr:hypothetical protein NHX12_013130 [Muraenolepis orangiensis]